MVNANCLLAQFYGKLYFYLYLEKSGFPHLLYVLRTKPLKSVVPMNPTVLLLPVCTKTGIRQATLGRTIIHDPLHLLSWYFYCTLGVLALL